MVEMYINPANVEACKKPNDTCYKSERFCFHMEIIFFLCKGTK